MRVRVLSDLHREFGSTEIPRLSADLIVLAGDIATKQNGLPWIRGFCRNTPAAYVCGNHEFYGDSLPRVTERLKEETLGSNLHVLEDDFFEVEGWYIYGCTLWTDMALLNDWEIGAIVADEGMNDYKRVRNSLRGYGRLTSLDTRRLHLRSLERMGEFFKTHDPRRTLVVTHHAPSLRSLPVQRRAEPISCAYASNLDEFMLKHQPYLWIHGHIHHNSDYLIGSTRVLANPQSYPDDRNEGFNPSMVIELPGLAGEA